MVERRLPKANVASSSLVFRSNRQLLASASSCFFCYCILCFVALHNKISGVCMLCILCL